MSYRYETERPKLFTDEGQRVFLQVRDNVHHLLGLGTGTFLASKAWDGVSGDSWFMLACLDRLEELGEIRCISDPTAWGQHRAYVAG